MDFKGFLGKGVHHQEDQTHNFKDAKPCALDWLTFKQGKLGVRPRHTKGRKKAKKKSELWQ